jgi:hypothetical protein
MLQHFLTSNRGELIARCKAKAAKRFVGARPAPAQAYGVPLLLQQIANALSLPSGGIGEKYEPAATPTVSELGLAAAAHGTEMMQRGFTIDQVVHEYGDVCQSVTELAEELKFPIEISEFRTLNGCLDAAIADAVTSYGNAGHVAANQRSEDVRFRIDAYSREQSRLVGIARGAFAAIESGNVGATGATGKLLSHALTELLRHAGSALADLTDLPEGTPNGGRGKIIPDPA